MNQSELFVLIQLSNVESGRKGRVLIICSGTGRYSFASIRDSFRKI